MNLWEGIKMSCKDGQLPDGPICPVCGGERLPSGIGGGTWVHIISSEKPIDKDKKQSILKE